MGCKYVKDFSFDAKDGYSGSAGKTMVRGYARGGSAKKPGYAKGGSVKKGGCSCGGKPMKAGGLTQAEAQLVNQVAKQASRTGRMPGVPVHSNTPLIRGK